MKKTILQQDPQKNLNQSGQGSAKLNLRQQQEQIDELKQSLEESQSRIKELEESNKFYQLVVDHLPHFFTFWKDLDSNILGCSKSFLEKAGKKSSEEIIGKSDFDMPWIQQAEAFRNIDQMVMKQNMNKYTVQEAHTPVDGKTLWLSTTKVALNNVKGEVIGLVGISEDITEKQKMDRLMRESEQRFHQFSEAAFEGVALHKNGVIVDANPVLAQMFNYDPDELKGKHLVDLNSPKFYDLIIENIKIGNTQPFRTVGLRRIRPGEPEELRQLDLEITLRNEPIQAISIRDITEQIKVEKLKDEFLANTSHELRTPLNGIIGIAESMNEGAAGPLPEIIVENLSMIISSSKRLYGLVNDILDYSKMRQHSLELQFSSVDLRSITEIVLSLSLPLIGDKPVKLLNQIPEDFPPVLADENRLQQILYNLIGNAIKFTAQGEVVVEAREKHVKIEIIVSDTGIGIPNSKQKKIFESFEQADSSTSREFGGTGLGLTISQQLVELHGGTLQVVNNPQIGSRFFFSLEKTEDKPKSQVEVSQRTTLVPLEYMNNFLGHTPNTNSHKVVTSAQGNGQLVLVIDDEPINLKVIQNFLELHHYQVLVAQSGFQALDILQYEQPDLILLDIMMPRMDGYELCGRIRELYDSWLLPIIFLTAKNEVSDLVRGLNSGANDFLTKPFSQEELLSRVKTHIRLKESVETLQENEQLKTEIARRKRVEHELNHSKKRMAMILDRDENAILSINDNQEIVFFNQQAEVLFGYSSQVILGKSFNLLCVQAYQDSYRQLFANLEQQIESNPEFKSHTKITLQNYAKEELKFLTSVTSFELKDEQIFTFVMNPEPVPENNSVENQINLTEKTKVNEFSSGLLKELMNKKETVHSLEGVFDNVIQYLIEGGKDILPQLREDLSPFFQDESSTNNSVEFRNALVDLMVSSLNTWKDITGKSKVDLAEASEIWKVYLDQDVFKTRTLDKYLKLEKLPQNPKWNKVIDTAQFVIKNCSPSNKVSMHRLKEHLAMFSSILEQK